MASKTIEIEGLDEQVKQLRRMMSEDPYFRRRVNAVIKTVLSAARKEVMQHAEGAMDSDPRHAYKAVRSAVYRRILGGNLNILQKRKAGAPGNYQKPRKGLPKRGGNRWGRSERTKQLEGYEGADRGFILRFVNAGASNRAIRSYTDSSGTRHDLLTHAKGGSRGNISARNWFGQASQQALENASASMQDFIDQIINEEFI
jgi:hypothetical protein